MEIGVVLQQIKTLSVSDSIILGEFCADAGLVGVFYLDEVIKYNPAFKTNLTNPNSIDLNAKEYKYLMTIITRLGYMFEYIIPSQELDNGTAITKYTGLTVRKNIKAYENGYVIPENIKEQVVKLISKNYK